MIRSIICKILFASIFILLVLSALFLPISAADINELDISIDERAGSVYLYNYESNRVLISHNAAKKLFPASTAKMMAGLLVCEKYHSELDRNIVITEQMLEGHTGASMNLQVGMEVTLRTLLYGTICGGNNDAAQALAVACSGSVLDFVDEMNLLALRLYMNDTHYKNPTGMDSDGAQTTLLDVARLARYVAKNELYVSISSLPSFEFFANGAKVATVYNRNALHSQFSATGYVNKYASGLIAGSTDNGGYVVVTRAHKNGMTYLCIVMGASADPTDIYSYSTANKLLGKAFDSYSLTKVASAGDVFADPEIDYTLVDGKKVKLPCVLSSDLKIVIKDGINLKNDIVYRPYVYQKDLNAPIRMGAVVGGVNIYCEDVLIGRADLVAENNVEPNFLLYSLKKMKDFVFGRVFAVGMLLSVISVSAYLHISSKNSRYKKVGTVRYNKFS
ncbi:MAG: D-alanyl-D-alanine carboxypeptidase [Ruminococcaceae bacterium]|nr:D-alanyl-D-alanine carboxypeptidase [Oscillospiraceae bacterium]